MCFPAKPQSLQCLIIGVSPFLGMCVLTLTPPNGAPKEAGLAEEPPGATEDWIGTGAGAKVGAGCNKKQT